MSSEPRDAAWGGRPDGSTTTGRPRSIEALAIAEDHDAWMGRTRVILTPMAAPSIMGLFGFMIATVMLGAWQAGWYGTAATPVILWPLALFGGGVMQGIAAIASLRARDGVATAAHTTWASFWLGWGILQLLVTTGAVAPLLLGVANPSFAIWFVVLTLVTFWCALGSLANNGLLFIVLSTLTGASAVTAAGMFAGNLVIERIGGWLFVISAAAAWLVAGAMTLEHAFGRTVIPLGKWSRAANVPGRAVVDPIAYPAGMPGVRVGQ